MLVITIGQPRGIPGVVTAHYTVMQLPLHSKQFYVFDLYFSAKHTQEASFRQRNRHPDSICGGWKGHTRGLGKKLSPWRGNWQLIYLRQEDEGTPEKQDHLRQPLAFLSSTLKGKHYAYRISTDSVIRLHGSTVCWRRLHGRTVYASTHWLIQCAHHEPLHEQGAGHYYVSYRSRDGPQHSSYMRGMLGSITDSCMPCVLWCVDGLFPTLIVQDLQEQELFMSPALQPLDSCQTQRYTLNKHLSNRLINRCEYYTYREKRPHVAEATGGTAKTGSH